MIFCLARLVRRACGTGRISLVPSQVPCEGFAIIATCTGNSRYCASLLFFSLTWLD